METKHKIAKYLALASGLSNTSPASDYTDANRLSFDLAIELPAELYGYITKAIAMPTEKHNVLTAVVKARELYGATGKLTENDIAYHAPGIGRLKK